MLDQGRGVKGAREGLQSNINNSMPTAQMSMLQLVHCHSIKDCTHAILTCTDLWLSMLATEVDLPTPLLLGSAGSSSTIWNLPLRLLFSAPSPALAVPGSDTRAESGIS